MKSNDVKLLILIPCRGTLVEGLVKWLWQAIPRAPFPVTWDTHHGRPEDDAKNGMVQRFLSAPQGYTHLMKIDDDIIPPPNALEMLLHDKPIVSAVVFTWKEGQPLALLMEWDEEQKGYKQDTDAINAINNGQRLIKLKPRGASGGGCFVVKREVYENLVTNWFRYEYDENGKVICGDDFNFYKRCYDEIGYPVWIDGAVQCGHMGSVDIREVQQSLARKEE